ncbi:MOP(MATE) family transporter: multidrug efflux [Bathycoccus prasinos]|uniref:Protein DETOXIFICATION n=1 Tax=Bathycoccus prasinos TaxID=41875 RepID=K8E9R3_9CHLO|nr:MOP(MATE) family transporter: multidrug efflux [Bathycoccus prasinos]CCO14507.1 MOP(MATE) family transporter: multidrug efflux [Bathycoccus prasinos]|eukprot:XP_007515628.1 MOP(MATE) family transporter: multidrug efflux [Bathycoccus prasinos]
MNAPPALRRCLWCSRWTLRRRRIKTVTTASLPPPVTRMMSNTINTKRDSSVIIAEASSSPFSCAMTTAEGSSEPENWRTNRRSADDETDEKEGGISVVWQTLGKPTLMKIISSVYILGVPSLLSVLCEPAIGCTESLLVGRVGMVYLAAIAPSSVMFWLIEEVCFALSVGVTTAVSEASAARSLISLDELDEVGGEKEGEKEKEMSKRRQQGNQEFVVTEETREIVQASVLAAFGLGIAFALAMQFMYAPAMRILGVSGDALRLGRLYTAIRCFGLPFFAVGVTFEGAYMGERDGMTPLCAFGLAMLATVVLQVALIHPSYGGLASVIGAGTAMSVGQLVAAGFLLVSANNRGFFNISQTVRRSSKDLPKLLMKAINLLNKSDVTDSTLWLFCGSASRMLVYTLCTALATQIGVIAAASNKYALDIYFFVCYLIEPLFTLGTVLLPKKLKTNKIEACWMRSILFCLAILSAIILCCVASITISAAGHFNLIEPELVKSLASVKPYVVASVGVGSFTYAADGIRIGMGGAKYVGKTQMFNLLLTVALAAWMKLYSPGSASMTLNHVWTLMVSFQFLRVCQHVYASAKSDKELLTTTEGEEGLEIKELGDGRENSR